MTLEVSDKFLCGVTIIIMPSYMYVLKYMYMKYRREGNFNILYFKLMFGFNFHIVWYARIQYSIAQKFSFGFNFHMHVNL